VLDGEPLVLLVLLAEFALLVVAFAGVALLPTARRSWFAGWSFLRSRRLRSPLPRSPRERH
jgi:hypothetical protein